MKIKENEKRKKYLVLTRELKKQWNMKVMVIPIVIGALGKIPKPLGKSLAELGMGVGAETIQTTEC